MPFRQAPQAVACGQAPVAVGRGPVPVAVACGRAPVVVGRGPVPVAVACGRAPVVVGRGPAPGAAVVSGPVPMALVSRPARVSRHPAGGGASGAQGRWGSIRDHASARTVQVRLRTGPRISASA